MGAGRNRWKDSGHDGWKDICMHHTFGWKQEGRAPEESQESYISIARRRMWMWSSEQLVVEQVVSKLLLRNWEGGSGVCLGGSSAFIINPMATLIYNSYRQMEVTLGGTQNHVYTHTFKALKIGCHTHNLILPGNLWNDCVSRGVG